MLSNVKNLLKERHFNDKQVEKLLPRLDKRFLEEPKYLMEILDTWNRLMGSSSPNPEELDVKDHIQPLAYPPKSSLLGAQAKIDMTTILAEVEPDLLLLDPEKLRTRHARILGLGLTQNKGQEWLLLYNAPRGFFMQDWFELSKKIYYIDHNIVSFLYDKKELKSMTYHPILKSAASVETNFDHIRARYLFAARSGYKSLSHMFDVEIALNRPTLKDLILADNASYLTKFAPFCSDEEYNTFSDLIKNYDVDEDDAEIVEKMAELDSL